MSDYRDNLQPEEIHALASEARAELADYRRLEAENAALRAQNAALLAVVKEALQNCSAALAAAKGE